MTCELRPRSEQCFSREPRGVYSEWVACLLITTRWENRTPRFIRSRVGKTRSWDQAQTVAKVL